MDNIGYTLKKWFVIFVLIGLAGTTAEIAVGWVWEFVLNHRLWIYYNDFYTSIESFILFGLLGSVGYWLYKRIRVSVVKVLRRCEV